MRSWGYCSFELMMALRTRSLLSLTAVSAIPTTENDGSPPDRNASIVTGGAGFTGINLIRYLLERGVAVRSVDLEDFTYADCRDRIEHIVGDIRDAEEVLDPNEEICKRIRKTGTQQTTKV